MCDPIRFLMKIVLEDGPMEHLEALNMIEYAMLQAHQVRNDNAEGYSVMYKHKSQLATLYSKDSQLRMRAVLTLFAVLFGIELLNQYTYGRKLLVEINHKP